MFVICMLLYVCIYVCMQAASLHTSQSFHIELMIRDACNANLYFHVRIASAFYQTPVLFSGCRICTKMLESVSAYMSVCYKCQVS